VSIRWRIFTVIGLVVAAALVQTWFVVRLERDRTSATTMLVSSLERLDNQSQLGRLIIQMESAQLAYGLSGDPQFRDDYTRLFNDYERTILVLPQSVEGNDQKRQLHEIDVAVRDWHHNASEAILARREREAVPLADIRALNDMRLRGIRARIGQFEALAINKGIEQRLIASSTSLMATIVSLAVPAVAIVMLLFLLALMARIVLDPLDKVARSARQISGGNFDVQLPPPGRDELGALIRAFQDMASAVQRRQRELTDALSREREISQMYAMLRAKAEQEHARLLATISTVPAALVILEASTGRIVLQNRAAETLIGREPDDDEARREHWRRFKLTYRDGTPCPLDKWGPSLALNGELIVGQELIIEQGLDCKIPILVSAAPLRDDQGAITGAVSAFQDITKLYEVDRLKSEFVSIVSHELRTPLTAIKGALQLLVAELNFEDPDHRMLVDVALSNTERLIRIINDILDISKIEAGKLELNPRPCDVGDLVRLSMQSVESIAKGALVSIVPVISPGTPHVMADPDRTVQAIVNLLSNALKYAPPRSEVTVDIGPHGAHHVKVSVTDRGRGIPADKLGQLFQKFQQVDGADTRRFRGTGLGLAITKALIEAQGGFVFVESNVGQGSTFAITIPVARGSNA
jgi:signal transduction histidine kinase